MTKSRLRLFEQVHPTTARSVAVMIGLCIVALVLDGSATLALAGSGGVATLPKPRVKVSSGLRMQFDTRWVDGTGYRPVRVRISPLPPGPAPADRSIRVTLRPRGYRRGNSASSVTQTVEIAQGAMFGEITMAIPHYEVWSSFAVETYEDGDHLRDLSGSVGFSVRNYHNWSEATPSIVVLEKDAPRKRMNTGLPVTSSGENVLPDVRALAGRIPLNHYPGLVTQGLFDISKDVDDVDILRLLIDVPRMDIMAPEDLPSRWIELTCIDIIVVSFAEVERIARDLPLTWQAILAWQASGTTLCVFGMGEEYERLVDLEKHLEIEPRMADDRHPYLRGWSEPNINGYAEEVHSLTAMNQNLGYYNAINGVISVGTSVKRKKGDPPDPHLFVIRDVRQGEVVAMRADNPFPGEPQDWAWMLNSLASDDWMWYRRHGLSMHRENPEYWNLLIPGVGEAPVNSFLVLITLFVVVIGPVNYFFLRRQRRLYLILVTVPLGAVIVTGSLLIYAMLTDGLGVRMRLRSVVEIDQPSGRVVSWSRQSYYAGLSPSEGLSFPVDAAVYPIKHRPIGRYGQREGRTHLIWGEDQRLASGFLTTRSTKQFLVVESRKTTLGLKVDETADPPLVTNHFGTVVEHLVVRISSGELFEAHDIDPGKTAGMLPIMGSDASTQWKKLLAANRPQFPVGFNPYQLENAADFFNSYSYYSGVDQGMSDPSFRTSIFERRSYGLINVSFSGMKPRAYLASVAEPIEVSIGVPKARKEAGFHLVTGRW
jgi:hypothetical protein